MKTQLDNQFIENLKIIKRNQLTLDIWIMNIFVQVFRTGLNGNAFGTKYRLSGDNLLG